MFSGIIEVEHWLTMGLKTFDNALTYELRGRGKKGGW